MLESVFNLEFHILKKGDKFFIVTSNTDGINHNVLRKEIEVDTYSQALGTLLEESVDFLTSLEDYVESLATFPESKDELDEQVESSSATPFN